ncbi:Pentatricopeptide repeat [Dillenia turbinata]|uniref:Pentatricopeptide repeat n=1 Tax=Dillenia turbinata TaxID=194707 RepID=A0AAN8UVC3_9MAGN
MYDFLVCCFSTTPKNLSSVETAVPSKRNWNSIPLPHRTVPDPKGHDLDFINVAYSHLVHSSWDKLENLAIGLTPFRIKHILLKIKKDYVLSLEFFNWVEEKCPNFHTLETHSIILHILTNNRKFKSAETILKKIVVSGSIDLPSRLFDAILYSYRVCDSSPRVFDSLFRTFAYLKKCRYATDTFCQMKDYGFYPTVESCNAYLSSLIDLDRMDIALAFYREMRRCRIPSNVYTLNLVMCVYCRMGRLEKAGELFREMEIMGLNPTVVSCNTLIAGYCQQGLMDSAIKLKNMMESKGLHLNVVSYNTLIHGFCKEGKLHEANKILTEMKAREVAPNVITYNTLINGYAQVGNSEMGCRLFDEMSSRGIKADILTYNALILGLCKEGKTRKAAYSVKELDKENLVPNSSTFHALILGQCVRKNSEGAFKLYKTMISSGCYPNNHTFTILISTFCKNKDFDGAVEILEEMLELSMVPEAHVLSELYSGLCRYGKEEIAMMLCRDIEARGLMPTGFSECYKSQI